MSRNNHNRSRSEIRSNSKFSEGVRVSLQEYSLEENRGKLEHFIDTFKSDTAKQTNLKALLYILNCLTAKKTDTALSFLTFNDAFDMFQSFKDVTTSTLSDIKQQKINFRNLLCSRSYGLCVYLVSIQSCEYVILRPDIENFSLDHLLPTLANRINEESEIITKEYCQNLISSMDSEWDKCVMRVFIACGRTNREYESLGFDSDCRVADKLRVDEYLAKQTELDAEAESMVIDALEVRKSKLSLQVKEKRRLLVEKQNKWTDRQIAEREEEVEDLEERINRTSSLMKDPSLGKSFSGMVARKKRHLIKVKRLKKRKLNAGRKRLINEDDEQYLSKCISEKATAHGRRKDTVLYLNHRVKKKDLLKLVNHRRAEKNLPLVKSVTSVFNRGCPKNKRSRQAKNHIGMALFCCKKSPKSEESSNILNHYCRSRKKNVSLALCKDTVDSGLVLFRSFDDKAYLCPGTKTGMDSTRKQKVLAVADEKLARKFQKYDWPNTMLSITPGVTLYMTKSVVSDDNGGEKLHIDSQDVLVGVKSKYFVGSSGSVWHGHLVGNRHRESVLHEIPNDISFESNPAAVRNEVCKLRDHCSSFLVQTMVEDVCNVAGNCECRSYELRKLNNLQIACENVAVALADIDSNQQLDNLHLLLSEAIALQERTAAEIEDVNVTGRELVKHIAEIEKYCRSLIDAAKSLGLPAFRPRIIDLTDSGPGVGINNHEAYYRIGQEILVCNYDYYIRIHLAPGDSSHNEVERMQSSVGDAIADGGYMEWEHEKKFAGLSDAEIEEMTPEELVALELERMKKNAFMACDEITSRIDGNAAPDGYMKAYTSPGKENLFFWDTEYLTAFTGEKTPSTSVPGYHFYTYVNNFLRSHSRIGEKSLEFVKEACTENGGQLCNFCRENPFYENKSMKRVAEPIPDYSHTQKFKYMVYDKAPTEIAGVVRPVDDYNPRVQLKAWVSEKRMSLDNPEQIKSFSSKYIVDEHLVVEELTHLKHLSLSKKSRTTDRKKKKDDEMAKKYEDFPWSELVEGGKLKKLLVDSLNKYLRHHKLQQFEKLHKQYKIDKIRSHYYACKLDQAVQAQSNAVDVDMEQGADDDIDDVSSSADESEDELSESDDEVIQVIDEDREIAMELDEEEDEGDWQDPSWFTTTRSGRVAGNPNLQNIYSSRFL